MRLVVQTNIFGEHHLWLVDSAGSVKYVSHRHAHHGADKLLTEIDRLVGRRTIHEIIVVRGPGAFTAIRAALVVTNMLGWLKNIPVSGVVRKNTLTLGEVLTLPRAKQKKFGMPVRPWYGRGPNITDPQKRR